MLIAVPLAFLDTKGRFFSASWLGPNDLRADSSHDSDEPGLEPVEERVRP